MSLKGNMLGWHSEVLFEYSFFCMQGTHLKYVSLASKTLERVGLEACKKTSDSSLNKGHIKWSVEIQVEH